MAYINEIKQLVKMNKKEYFEVIIRDAFFVVEGFFEIVECKESFIYLKGKKDNLIFHGEHFRLECIKRGEIVFLGCVKKLERSNKC